MDRRKAHGQERTDRGYGSDVELICCGVAAGLPRQISNDFDPWWRHKAAATPIFISLLDSQVDSLFKFESGKADISHPALLNQDLKDVSHPLG